MKIIKRISAIIIMMVAITMSILISHTEAANIKFEKTGGAISGGTGISSAGDIIGAGQGFINKGKGNAPISMSEAQNLLPLGRIVMGIALGVLVAVGMIMGVKYMISGADERANMKQKLIWYLVAAVLILAPVGVYNLIVGIMSTSGLS